MHLDPLCINMCLPQTSKGMLGGQQATAPRLGPSPGHHYVSV
jgi:hypothetical protein